MTATLTARRAARSEGMRGLARFGLAARATIYLLIGVLALLLAFGRPHGEADQRGALQELARHTGGTVLVAVIAGGLAAYAVWRWSEAAFGVAGEGRKAGPRVKSFVRGCVYAFLAVNAVLLLLGRNSSSQAGEQEQWTAKAMHNPAGRWAVGVVGVIVVVVGLALIRDGVTRKFEKHLDTARMSRTQQALTRFLGTVGTTARGVAFALAGVFLVVAAWRFDPSESQGLDGALRSLADTAAGPALLGIVALGLIMFGLYGYVEAGWRRV